VTVAAVCVHHEDSFEAAPEAVADPRTDVDFVGEDEPPTIGRPGRPPPGSEVTRAAPPGRIQEHDVALPSVHARERDQSRGFAVRLRRVGPAAVEADEDRRTRGRGEQAGGHARPSTLRTPSRLLDQRINAGV